MLRQVLREARVDACIDHDLRTSTRHAIVVSTEEHLELVTQLLSESGWEIDTDYEPTAEDIAEQERREQLRNWSLRRTITLSNPYVVELFGGESKGRRRHWNSRY